MSDRRDFEAIWNSLPNPVLTIDAGGAIAEVNSAAEDFLGASRRQLAGRNLAALAGADSRLADLLRQVMRQGVKMAEYGVELGWPEQPARLVDLHAAPMADRGAERGAERGAGAVVMIHPRAIVETMDRSLSHRNAARSVAGMAQMLAHEIRNPLAGISGAAQLLQMNLSGEDRELTALIREESERIGAL
ncbi:MAG: PAS domain-containing protein, partial [Proteobacteria bacterium]|nr:PAS domain-containing protein [Pseudomonadota bacterium]